MQLAYQFQGQRSRSYQAH